MAEVRKQKGTFSRDGYNNSKTIRDGMDPRVCGTKFIADSRNILKSMWYSYFWPKITYDMEYTQQAIYKHAYQTHGFGDHVLLSQYGNGDFYGRHVDTDMGSVVTAVLMLSFNHKFTGGDLEVEDFLVPFQHNRLVVFPSCTPHRVTKIENESTDFLDQRFTLQYFVSAVSLKKPLIDESSNIK